MREHLPPIFLALATTVLAVDAHSQALSPWRAHDANRPRPSVVQPADELGAAPSDAIRLFDGSDLAQWTSPDGEATKWKLADGCLVPTPNAGPIQTTKSFGDVQLHLEWSSPQPVSGGGQGRGNSGVFLMTKYEVQILDSYQNVTYADGQAAAVYGQYPPLVNATRPPGEWQTYDIVFRRPHFDEDGRLKAPGVMTVFHNGVLVQDHVELWGPTNWLEFDEYQQHPNELPIALQDHGNPVRFRHIWARRLSQPQAYTGLAEAEPDIVLTAAQLDRLVGTYEVDASWKFEVRRRGDDLQISVLDRYFTLVPHSPTEFEFKRTDAQVAFEVGEDGIAKQIVVNLMGSRSVAVR